MGLNGGREEGIALPLYVRMYSMLALPHLCLLALAGVFEVGKAHLAHGRLGTGSQSYFSTSADLFGEPLGLELKVSRWSTISFTLLIASLVEKGVSYDAVIDDR